MIIQIMEFHNKSDSSNDIYKDANEFLKGIPEEDVKYIFSVSSRYSGNIVIGYRTNEVLK